MEGDSGQGLVNPLGSANRVQVTPIHKHSGGRRLEEAFFGDLMLLGPLVRFPLMETRLPHDGGGCHRGSLLTAPLDVGFLVPGLDVTSTQ